MGEKVKKQIKMIISLSVMTNKSMGRKWDQVSYCSTVLLKCFYVFLSRASLLIIYTLIYKTQYLKVGIRPEAIENNFLSSSYQ